MFLALPLFLFSSALCFVKYVSLPDVCVYLAFEDEHEGERALAGQVGVALGVVNARLQHPRLVENGEARCFIVQTGDEVVGAVRPELHLWRDE